VDLYPLQKTRFDARMAALGLDPSSTTQDVTTPAGIGNVAAAVLLAYRHDDGSNQHGTLGSTGLPYSDYTSYIPVNSPDIIADANRWQPLRHPNRNDTAIVEQICLGAHWHLVVPFALLSADQFRPPAPRQFPHGRYRQQAEELIRQSATVGDREKVTAEYWSDGPMTALPPGHFNVFARELGLYHESRGESGRAIQHLSRFVELWSAADPPLQPIVQDARQRIAALRAYQ
jgi:hypothetical protein